MRHERAPDISRFSLAKPQAIHFGLRSWIAAYPNSSNINSTCIPSVFVILTRLHRHIRNIVVNLKYIRILVRRITSLNDKMKKFIDSEFEFIIRL